MENAQKVCVSLLFVGVNVTHPKNQRSLIMSIMIKYVKLFTSEGRLLKEIPRIDLPMELPEIIEYASNYFRRPIGTRDYSECSCYHYEEKAVVSEKTGEEVANILASVADTPHRLDTL
jgi:hypothetical protein